VGSLVGRVGVGVGCEGCWELLGGGGEKGQGSDVQRGDGVPVQEDDIQEAPPHATKSKAQAGLTGLRAREPPSKTSPATRRYDGTTIGSQITTQRNSEPRRLSRD
jgi:hypothetical protein